jgi:predicted XRE-type DNA-binding protein
MNDMKNARYDRLKQAGWMVGTTAEFLGLTEEEAALIEMKLALAHSLREHRDGQRLTQEQLARMLGSSQSRVAKMEAADSSVSMELLVRSLLMLGATRKEIGRVLARDPAIPAA